MVRRLTLAVALGLLVVLGTAPARTQFGPVAVTSPVEAFGSAVGDDYFLATYAQLETYWHTLAGESDRMVLEDIGRTEGGRTQWMAVISAPENLAHLDQYREIARRLALAEGLDEAAARALAAEGKVVVWIDGGLHADEVLGAQQLIEMVYRLVSGTDADTRQVLRDVIVLAVHANPDGHALVADWYMREADPRQRSLENVPELYQKYAGHDNNRDFFLSSQAETVNLNRVLYREWFPQIVYDHHQTAPPGTVMFAPPFREPSNYLFDPLIVEGLDRLGAAMHARFAAEGKAGVTMRSGADYSTWWNGGLRTTAYFHNQIGVLTETVGGPTPTAIRYVASRQVAGDDLPDPIAPQRWPFRRAVEYSLTANRAVLEYASRNRATLLFDVYRMGRNAIERGSRDTWLLESARAEASRPPEPPDRRPATRDPRGYVLPVDQGDAAAAATFVNALLRAGVVVERATAPFAAAGIRYSAGSYVVKTAQAFGPHVLDMFEAQHHPDDVPLRGGAPTPPYDNAGWTLAFQMGISFDRVLDAFEGPFVPLWGEVSPAPGRVTGSGPAAGFLVSHRPNGAFTAANRVLAAGGDVFWPRDRGASGGASTTGAMWVTGGPEVRTILEQTAAELGLTFTVAAAPAGDGLALRPVRVGLWDRYGGSAASGWTRWVLERFEFPFELVYPPAIDDGGLASRFDVLLLPDGAMGDGPRVVDAGSVPPEYRDRVGRLSVSQSVPRLREFVEVGGTLIAAGSSTVVARYLDLPVARVLGNERPGRGFEPLPVREFYVPGSVLRMQVDNTHPLAYGVEREVDVLFDNSPVFAFEADGEAAGARAVGTFGASSLRSGWAWGEWHLDESAGILDVPLGLGRVVLLGPAVVHRGQSHGTFKFLFNAIFLGAAEPTQLSKAE